MEQQEHYFKCPYCFQRISMLLDSSVETQTFIEDCEVCCNPIEIFYIIEDNEVGSFSAQRIQ